MLDKKLPHWIKVSIKIFDTIKNKVWRVKNLLAVPGGVGFRIYVRNTCQLILDMENNEITQQEVLKKISEIRKFIKILKSQNTITANQIKALNALFMADEIFTGINRYTEENSEGELEVISEKSEKEPKFEESIAERIKLKKQRTDEQPDTTDMPDLEIEESVAQRGNQQGKGLRILKANQMLIRLPIFKNRK